MKIKKKKYIAKRENGEYCIDKLVNKNRKTGEIKQISFYSCPNMKPNSAVKFYEDEKNWLEENCNEKLEWIDYDA